MDTLNLKSTFIFDCFECVAKGSKNEMLVCLVTVTAGFIIRHFEKKRIERREQDKKLDK